ncbi:ADP ribosylation factor like GTPase 9 L homeolog [Xenopus laevis]|uniref:ADP ribosylation factor like GTPase 9 L homeolog n=1 Tax=Xenopus laevis TaxID=8355 RepID=Q05AV2_XENLA|nr:ADP ribosylation factor like GTPase 9 L homeolog [Xenopus laevis]AAI23320.1 MGC154697 protein [Xenopus laevis]
MSGLRNLGLAVAMLAASGGAALLTWSYITTKRRKEEQKEDVIKEEQKEEVVAKEEYLPVESQVAERCMLLAAREQPQREPQTRKRQVLVLGLDGSGKTSILNSIVTNRGNHSTVPTEGIHAVCITNGKSKMEFLEVGGSEQLRPFWERYLDRAFALVYIVDSTDHGRLPLAKKHLHQLIQHDSSLPLVVLANKQDLENAYHITDIHDALALSEICEERKLFLIGTHVATDGSELPSSIEDTQEFLAQLLLETH